MEKTLSKLEKWIKVFQKSILVLAGIETVIVLIIGIASNNLTNNIHSNLWITILIILSILYVAITILKIAYNKNFPITIVEELKAKENLIEAQKLISRKNAINNYISNTILLLSNCKCEIPKQTEGADWKIDSDKDFLIGMKSLTSIFNNILNVLLDTTNFKFSTGIYLQSFRAFNHEHTTENNSGIFFLRDDYELGTASAVRDLMTNNNVSGIELEIQNSIKVSLNNGKFLTKEIEVKTGNILLICTNIQNLKEKTHQKGVLLIITNPIKELPEDIESVLKVFTNLISHWEDLYDHEVKSQQIIFITDDDDDQEDLNTEVPKIEE